MAARSSPLRAARARLVGSPHDLDSKRIARVIFCMGDGHMILLHGFIKKTQKTPQADIALALKRKREVT